MTEKHSANTEEKILEAAKTVFIEEGKAGARMQMIADRAGINKSLLHYYYRSKDKLFASVFKFALNKMAIKIIKIFKTDDGIYVQLEQFIESYLKIIMSNPFIPMFILGELNKKHNNIAAELMMKSGIDISLFEETVTKEIKKGTIKNINPKNLLINVISLCVFPIIAKPMIVPLVFEKNMSEFELYLKNRKKEVTDIVFNMIKI